MYFIESFKIKATAVEAIYTEEGEDVVFLAKENPREITFGYHTDPSARGVYLLNTNSKTPYLSLNLYQHGHL